MARRGKHITEWFIRENRLCGKHNGVGIITSPIANIVRYADMQMITTASGSIYFIYDDRK
jgi:hypothetical protein